MAIYTERLVALDLSVTTVVQTERLATILIAVKFERFTISLKGRQR